MCICTTSECTHDTTASTHGSKRFKHDETSYLGIYNRNELKNLHRIARVTLGIWLGLRIKYSYRTQTVHFLRFKSCVTFQHV